MCVMVIDMRGWEGGRVCGCGCVGCDLKDEVALGRAFVTVDSLLHSWLWFIDLLGVGVWGV